MVATKVWLEEVSDVAKGRCSRYTAWAEVWQLSTKNITSHLDFVYWQSLETLVLCLYIQNVHHCFCSTTERPWLKDSSDLMGVAKRVWINCAYTDFCLDTGFSGKFSMVCYIYQTTRARDFKFAGAAVVVDKNDCRWNMLGFFVEGHVLLPQDIMAWNNDYLCLGWETNNLYLASIKSLHEDSK